MRSRKSPTKKRRNSTPRNSSFRPKLEQLEDRRLLAGDVELTSVPLVIQNEEYVIDWEIGCQKLPTEILRFTDPYYVASETIEGNLRVTMESTRGNSNLDGTDYWKFNLYERDTQGTPTDQSDDTWIFTTTLASGDYGSSWASVQDINYSVVIENDTIFLQIRRVELANHLAGAPVGTSYLSYATWPSTLYSAVHIFEKGTSWEEFNEIVLVNPNDSSPRSEFGFSIAVEGDKLLIGAPEEDNQRGAVYLYDGSQGWENASFQRFVNSDAQEGDYFGYSVDMQGEYLVIGAPQKGHYTSVVSLGLRLNNINYRYKQGPGFANLYSASTGTLLKRISNYDLDHQGFGSQVNLDGDKILVTGYKASYEFDLNEQTQNSSFPFLSYATVKVPTQTTQDGQVEEIPNSLTEISEWEDYFVELYLQIPENSSQSLSEIVFRLNPKNTDINFDLDTLLENEWLDSIEISSEEEQQVYRLKIDSHSSTLQSGAKILLARFTANSFVDVSKYQLDGAYWVPVIESYEIKSNQDTFSSKVEQLKSTTIIRAVRYDVNDDDRIGLSDLMLVIQHFGEKTYENFSAYRADVNNDGEINLADISLLISHFGEFEDQRLSLPSASQVIQEYWCGTELLSPLVFVDGSSESQVSIFELEAEAIESSNYKPIINDRIFNDYQLTTTPLLEAEPTRGMEKTIANLEPVATLYELDALWSAEYEQLTEDERLLELAAVSESSFSSQISNQEQADDLFAEWGLE